MKRCSQMTLQAKFYATCMVQTSQTTRLQEQSFQTIISSPEVQARTLKEIPTMALFRCSKCALSLRGLLLWRLHWFLGRLLASGPEKYPVISKKRIPSCHFKKGRSAACRVPWAFPETSLHYNIQDNNPDKSSTRPSCRIDCRPPLPRTCRKKRSQAATISQIWAWQLIKVQPRTRDPFHRHLSPVKYKCEST